MKKIIIGITLLLLLYLPNVKASTGITGYTCLNGENTQACTEVIKGTELIGNNNERFIVMKVVDDTAYLMTKYLLIDDEVNGGYKQASSATTGKTVAYGSSATVNIGGYNSKPTSGDLALSYINSINTVSAPATAVNNPTTTGKNGIPSLTLMCEYSGTCGTVSNEGLYTAPYTTVQTYSGLTGNILLGDTSTAPYGYWTSSASDDYHDVWNVGANVSDFYSDYYWDEGDYGVRPVFTISSSSISGMNVPATGIDTVSSLVISTLGIIAIAGMVIYSKKNNLIRA